MVRARRRRTLVFHPHWLMTRHRPPKTQKHGPSGEITGAETQQRSLADISGGVDPNAPTRVMRQGGDEAGPRPGGPAELEPGDAAPLADPTGSDTGPSPRRGAGARITGLGSGLLARQPGPRPGEGVTVRKVCPHCATEYETDARFCPKDGAALRPVGGSDPLIGHTLGDRYHILSLVGEGGMGRIYLAEHVRMNRQCAVKIMRPTLVNDADAAARFAREASSAARIIHPNVAAVFDYGESEGNVYLVMEFVEGEPLGAILERERTLPLARALELTRQVADALAAAHELGIVHRDLKPDNILVARTKSGREVAKVVDFGIAKAVEEGPGQKLTETGLVIGTPEFMSPEQLMGDPVDARSDVYSLGCILYLMLVGVPAADAPTREGMLKRRLSETAPHPRSADETLPPELDAIVARALAPAPDDRFQSAGDLRDALATLAAGAPAGDAISGQFPASAPLAPHGVTGERAAAPAGWYTHRRGLGVAGVLMLGIIAVALLQTDRGAGASPANGAADSLASLPRPTIAATPAPANGAPPPATTAAPTGTGTAAVVPPPPAPRRTPAQILRADSLRRAADAAAALRRALQPGPQRFADAVAARDMNALRAAYPGLTGDQERIWSSNFRMFSRITARVRYGEPLVSGDAARQPFRLIMTLADEQGTSTQNSVEYVARYERAGGQWVLRAFDRQ